MQLHGGSMNNACESLTRKEQSNTLNVYERMKTA